MESEKLVSADSLREWLKKIPLHDLSDGRGLCCIIFAEDFERAMASFPGDAIQIVRCKDCIYRIDGRCFSRTSFLNAPAVEPDNFCSWGATE